MELPEDSDEKVRRNLVSFSAAVLLIAWLQIPFATVAEKVGLQEDMPPLRMWIAAGAVLLYLWARFHFNGGKEAIATLRRAFGSALYPALSRHLSDNPLRPHVYAWITPKPAEVIERARQAMEKSGKQSSAPPRVYFYSAPWTFKGVHKLNVVWIEGQRQTVVFSHDEDVTYSVPVIRRVLLFTEAVWFSWIFSAEALSLLAPLLLGGAAAIVIAWRCALLT